MSLEESWLWFGRVAIAAVLGALIGIERDLNGKPAGLRTHMILAVGSCFFGIISSEGYRDAEGDGDPTRIASIIVQGIGFIGAGVLLKGERTVMGLTTAASIWLVAAIGLAVGAGLWVLATLVTIFAVVILFALDPVSSWLEEKGNARMKRLGKPIVKEE